MDDAWNNFRLNSAPGRIQKDWELYYLSFQQLPQLFMQVGCHSVDRPQPFGHVTTVRIEGNPYISSVRKGKDDSSYKISKSVNAQRLLIQFKNVLAKFPAHLTTRSSRTS